MTIRRRHPEPSAFAAVQRLAAACVCCAFFVTPAMAGWIEDYLTTREICGPRFPGLHAMVTAGGPGVVFGRSTETWTQVDLDALPDALRTCQRIAAARGAQVNPGEATDDIVAAVHRAWLERDQRRAQSEAAGRTAEDEARRASVRAGEERMRTEERKRVTELNRTRELDEARQATARAEAESAEAQARRGIDEARRRTAEAQARAKRAVAEAARRAAEHSAADRDAAPRPAISNRDADPSSSARRGDGRIEASPGLEPPRLETRPPAGADPT